VEHPMFTEYIKRLEKSKTNMQQTVKRLSKVQKRPKTRSKEKA